MNTKGKVLVTGANGQLGSELKRTVLQNYEYIFTDIAELDLLNREELEQFVIENCVSCIVNCAAYTAVDKAESEVEKAESVNIQAVRHLAEICREHKVKLIHISTDFVFDGNANSPYKEHCTTNPLSVYGRTKLEGEQALGRLLPDSIIIRTSWLYSSYGSNFVKTILRLGSERDELGIIFDQLGTPTYAYDLACCIVEIINSGLHQHGIYHYSNEGMASWYDFAVNILDIAGIACKVKPIPGTQYPTPAARPAYSIMDKTKIKQDFGITIPYWRDSLVACLGKMKS